MIVKIDWDTIKDFGFLILIILFVVGGITGLLTILFPPEREINYQKLFEEAGWEKVCVEWKAYRDISDECRIDYDYAFANEQLCWAYLNSEVYPDYGLGKPGCACRGHIWLPTEGMNCKLIDECKLLENEHGETIFCEDFQEPGWFCIEQGMGIDFEDIRLV